MRKCCRNNELFLWGINKQLLLYFLLKSAQVFSFSIFLWSDLLSAFIFQSVGSYFLCFLLLSSPGWCVWVGVWLFVPCRCCLCCVGLVTRFPLFSKQAATVEDADPGPWKMASIIREPVCSWQFGKLDSSGYRDKSLWGTKDVPLHTFSRLQQLLGGLSPSIAGVEIHTVLKI